MRVVINLNPKKMKESPVWTQIIMYIPLFKKIAILGGLVLTTFTSILISKLVVVSHHRKLWEEWRKKEATISELKKNNSSYKKNIEEFRKVILDKQQSGYILKDVLVALENNIGFENLSLTEQELLIIGYVVPWKINPIESINKFADKLKKQEKFSQYFNSIVWEDTYKDTIGGVEILRFKLRCLR